MNDPPQRPFEWDRTKPIQITALRPLERVGHYYGGPIAHMPDKHLPVGEFLDKFSGRWVRCTFREYLRSIGWNA